MAATSFGRRVIPDTRDANYPMRLAVPQTTSRSYRYWYDNGWWGDQGDVPACVGYAWAHWVEDGPVTPPRKPQPYADPLQVYQLAQKLDEWPGEGYEGSSVRGGAKALRQRGCISAFYWTLDVNELARAILERGPVVVGTNWYAGMLEPRASDGLIRVTGEILGGHAYELNGVNLKRAQFRVKNSWGRLWGRSGRALISFDDMARLLKEDGEACLATEADYGSLLSKAG